ADRGLPRAALLCDLGRAGPLPGAILAVGVPATRTGRAGPGVAGGIPGLQVPGLGAGHWPERTIRPGDDASEGMTAQRSAGEHGSPAGFNRLGSWPVAALLEQMATGGAAPACGSAAAVAAGLSAALAGKVARRSRDCLGDRKSTRLNSSHVSISYAVFCLKKKKKRQKIIRVT